MSSRLRPLIEIANIKPTLDKLCLCTGCNDKAKQPESGDLCGDITEFGWRKDHLSPQGEGDRSTTPHEVILPYSTPDEGMFCIYILLFKLFQAKIYEINDVFITVFYYFKSQCRNTCHYNTKGGIPGMNTQSHF